MDEQRELELETIDLIEIGQKLLKWKWVVIIGTLMAVLAAGIVSFFVLEPVYESQVDLLVTQGQDQKVVRQGEDGLEGVVDVISRLPQMTINSFVGQIKNPALLQEVMKELKLDPQFYSLQSLSKAIEVKTTKDSNIITVVVEDNNPAMASKIANTLTQKLLDLISKNNQVQMQKSVEFLEKQLKEEEKNLDKAAGELKKFQSQARGVTLLQKSIEAKSQNLTDFTTRLSLAKVEKEQLLAGKSKLESSLASTPQVIKVKKSLADDPGAAALIGNGQAQGTIVVEEINPAYVSLKEAINEKTKQLAEKEAEIVALEASVNALTEEINKLQAELVDKQLKQEKLQQEVERLQKNRALLAEKITQTRIAKSINLGETNLQIVAPALIPEKPVKPHKLLNLLIALVLGFVLSSGLALIMDRMDNTIETAEDLQELLQLPVLATIPKFDLSEGEDE